MQKAAERFCYSGPLRRKPNIHSRSLWATQQLQ